MSYLTGQRGAGLITAIVLLVVVGIIGAAFVSLINTESFSAMGQVRGLEAEGVSEGGIEYALLAGPGFPNFSVPPYSTRSLPIGQCNGNAGICLGSGWFFVDSPTVLTSNINNTDTIIPVVSTSGFGATGRIIINAEEIDYTGIGALPGPCAPFAPPCFTGATRGAGLPPTSAAAHNLDHSVYPATTLNAVLNPGDLFIDVASTAGFLAQGTVRIRNENIYYTGTTATTFTGLTRCYKNSCGAPPAHAAGRTVKQFVIQSTGTVPGSVFGDARRVIQVTVGP